MKVFHYLMEKLKKEKLHFTLIDPAEQSPKEAGSLAAIASIDGTDAILVGGSSLKKEALDETIREVKKCGRPVILFPPNSNFLSGEADAIFFMSLLNSTDKKYLVGEQVKASLAIKRMGIEPISMGYLVIEPGMRVGMEGKVELVKREDVDSAVRYSLAAQYFGMKFVYLEAGSGSPMPVPNEMIRAVKKEISVPLIVGGGIKNASIAKEKIEAGADIIVTGNIIERDVNRLKEIISVIKPMK
jgi:phosphoglycerol geranylgeranyltransferase